MFTRTLLAFVLLVCTFAYVPVANAQTTNVSEIVARMKEIAAEMQQLQSEFTTLASKLSAGSGSPSVLGAQTSTVSPASFSFTQPLVFGETNDDIKKIQALLATDPEIYPYGVASGFFGPKTEEAIKNLQTRFGLDPVGVIGPATTALLAGYFGQYPDGNFPDGVLSTKPQVLGVTTSNSSETGVDALAQITALQQQLTVLEGGNSSANAASSDNPADSIETDVIDDETWITIKFNDGRSKMRLAIDSEDEDEIVAFVAAKTDLSESQIWDVIEFGKSSRSSRSSSSDNDEGDAEDAIDDAKAAIHDARDEIRKAEEDDEDIDWADEAYDEARDLYNEARDAFKDEDWDEAVELAEEAEDMADEAIDRIGNEKGKSAGDIDDIFAYVGDGRTEVYVEYEDDDDDFTVKTDDEDEIISEVADVLDIDEDEVEDLITFYGKKVERIDVEINDDESYVEIEFEDGDDKTYSLKDTDENDIIESLANKLDLPEKEIKKVIHFD